jgi:hypothetical protein
MARMELATSVVTHDGLKRHEALQRSKVRALRLTDAGDLRGAVATICRDAGKIFDGLDPTITFVGLDAAGQSAGAVREFIRGFY